MKLEINAFLKEQFPQTKIVVDEVSDGHSIVRLPISHDMLRPGGTVSGPTMMGVADAAIYVAIFGAMGIIPLAVTTSFNINFFKKPKAGCDIIGECNLLKIGKVLVVGEVSIYSEGDEEPVAHAVGTYSIPPKK